MIRLETELDRKITNPLAEILEEEIRAKGKISFDRLMSVWASGAKDRNENFIPGFYTSGEAIIGDNDGRLPRNVVDFYTPPEESPVFGFSLGSQILQMWEKMGMPDDFKVVEMGAGNATLAHDILCSFDYFKKKRGYKNDPSKSIDYVVVESSRSLAEKQKKRISNFNNAHVIQGDATNTPLRGVTGVFISCELPDAFPSHLVRKVDGGWQELFLTEGDNLEFGRFWEKPTEDVSDFLSRFSPKVEENRFYPVNIGAEKFIKGVGASLERGFVLTVDYDCWDRKNSNLKVSASLIRSLDYPTKVRAAFSKKNVGNSDITTGVDFQILADVGKEKGLKPEGFVTLSGFLFGLSADKMIIDFQKDFPDNKIGDRIHSSDKSYKFYSDCAGWKVLVQSKGVESSSPLYGTMFEFNEDREDGTNLIDVSAFRRIKY